jgi:heat shock protein HtpX
MRGALCAANPLMYEQISANKRRSALLIFVFVALIVAVGWAVSTLIGYGIAGTIVALVISAAMAVGSYWFSDKIALRVSRARPADPTQYQRLHNLVDGLCIAGGLPKPAVYVMDDPAPNAFATGRNPQHASIAVTTGLLDMMNRVELEGVLAHELSHIKNYDVLVSTISVVLLGAVVIISDLAIRTMWWNGGRTRREGDRNDTSNPLAIVGFAILLLAPLLGKMFQFALSRRRESLADVSAVSMTRYPPGLISALEKLDADCTVTHSGTRATAHLWIEHPVPRDDGEGRLQKFNRMFDTHPPLRERISLLQEL